MSAVNDAEQVENAKAFLSTYGKPILGVLVLVAIGFGGWSYWQHSQEEAAQLNTAKVQKLLNETRQLEDTTSLSGFVATANKITEDAPNSVHAIQAQLIIAEQAMLRKEYTLAESALKQVSNSSNDDQGLVAIVNIRLANAQVALEKYDEALATLNQVKVEQFKANVEERKGDIYLIKNDQTAAKTAYQTAWDETVKADVDNQILRMKLERVGVFVEQPVVVESPILQPAP